MSDTISTPSVSTPSVPTPLPSPRPARPCAAAAAGSVAAHAAGQARADRILAFTARLWFLVAIAGQLIFATYVMLFYGRAAAAGDFARWNKTLPHGYVAGDTIGNTVVALHLLGAVIVIVGGALQLSTAVRRRAPRLHRWNGWLYFLSALSLSLGGLYMAWVRGGAVGDLPQHLAISGNALVILLCAGMAVRHAMARDFRTHRRWALRLFLVMSGVWFFRIGLMLSFLIFRRPVGFDPASFTGPFLTFLGFAQYLLPLAVLELYLRAQSRPGAARRWAMAAALGFCTLATAAGIFGATMGMWLPRL